MSLPKIVLMLCSLARIIQMGRLVGKQIEKKERDILTKCVAAHRAIRRLLLKYGFYRRQSGWQ